MRRTRSNALLPISRLRKVADIAPGLITVYNVHTNRYVYVNETVRRLLGYSPEDFLTKGVAFVASLIHPDDFKAIMEKNSRALAAANQLNPEVSDNEPIVNFEYRMRHGISGKWVWLHTDGSVFDRQPDGKIEHVLNISVDISVAKAAERKLRQLNQQLLALSNTKDEFISIASHQLRTPATAVKLYIGMLLQGYAGELDNNQQAYAEVAYKNNEQLIKIINDLLGVARLDAGKLALEKAKCDVVRLLSDLATVQAKKFELRNQQLIFSSEQQRVQATIDKDLLGMAIENIIDNAGKYSPEGGKVHIHLTRDAHGLHLHISDGGIGIAKKDYKKLFQKFSRVERGETYATSGTGLGLYWAKKVIGLHGGTIDFISELNKGSTFTIHLPLL